MVFDENDIKILEKNNKSLESAKKEFDILTKGRNYVKIIDSARIDNNGIILLDETNFEKYKNIGKKVLEAGNVLRFSPASGAASRMFKKLQEFKNNENVSKINQELHFYVSKFGEELDQYAFYEDLKQTLLSKGITKEVTAMQIISHLLTEEGLNYSNTPKAFIKFHKYSDEDIRDSFEEQIVEGLSAGIKKFHFTFSKDHEPIAVKRIKHVKEKYDSVNISYSFQDPSTNTIALDIEKQTPVKKENGELLLRMGGHGALIKNVNEHKSEYTIIKNIDNVGHEDLHDLVIENVRLNLGLIEEIKQKVFDMIKRVKGRNIDIKTATKFLESELKIGVPKSFYEKSDDEKYEIIFNKLNRPIKVCQMVPNQGEPGGGPIWVKGKDEFIYLRIAEQAECEGGQNNKFMKEGTHFNPVNLTIYSKDYQGNDFDLNKYINWDSCFLSDKSYEGKNITALELPGLWNGAMEDVITLFVEAPIETFNPVKYIEDLLRDSHQVN